MQHQPTLLDPACCTRLATMLCDVAWCLMTLSKVWFPSNVVFNIIQILGRLGTQTSRAKVLNPALVLLLRPKMLDSTMLDDVGSVCMAGPLQRVRTSIQLETTLKTPNQLIPIICKVKEINVCHRCLCYFFNLVGYCWNSIRSEIPIHRRVNDTSVKNVWLWNLRQFYASDVTDKISHNDKFCLHRPRNKTSIFSSVVVSYFLLYSKMSFSFDFSCSAWEVLIQTWNKNNLKNFTIPWTFLPS